MAIQITGSWNLTGSFTSSLGFQGTSSYATTASYALTGGSGGGSTFPYTGSAQITGSLSVTGSLKVNNVTLPYGANPEVVMPIYLGPITNTYNIPSSSVVNYYATSSGVHILKDNNPPGTLTNSASLNIYFNTNTISDGGYVYVIFYIQSGSASPNFVSYRSIIVNDGALPIYNQNGAMSAVGGTNVNVARNATGPRYTQGNSAVGPMLMTKVSGSMIFSFQPYNNYLNVYGPYSASAYGTPIGTPP
jgi:hypothetical protein